MHDSQANVKQNSSEAGLNLDQVPLHMQLPVYGKCLPLNKYSADHR